jgi:hypothetical protein
MKLLHWFAGMAMIAPATPVRMPSVDVPGQPPVPEQPATPYA